MFFSCGRRCRQTEVGQTITVIIKGILRLLDKGIRRTVNGSGRNKGSKNSERMRDDTAINVVNKNLCL
jgi:hypothetical protein